MASFIGALCSAFQVLFSFLCVLLFDYDKLNGCEHFLNISIAIFGVCRMMVVGLFGVFESFKLGN